MTKSEQKNAGLGVFELVEEAIALLRRTPASALLWYYAGTAPFWLVFLYFVADMSRSGLAPEHLASSSLGVALSFLWMKCCQCVYTSQLRAGLQLEPEAPWTPGRVIRMAATQVAIQPWGLFLRLFGYIVALPFVWISSFCQNATVLGGAAGEAKQSVSMRSWQQAQLWPWRAHALVSLLGIFGFFVWIDISAMMFAAPALLKTFFGVETMASRGMGALFNTTFIAASYALTCMCIDPIWKAAYVLRCFYGDSRSTGADLRLQLRGIKSRVAPVLAVLLAAILAAASLPTPARAADPAPVAAAESAKPTVDPEKLDGAIRSVLDRREYTWRQPRQPQKADDGVISSWMKSVAEMLRNSFHKAKDLFRGLRKWWRRLSGDRESPEESGSGGFPPMQEFLYGALAIAIVGLGWAAWRAWTAQRLAVVVAEAVPAMPDLQSEDVAASDLPEDGWLQFARELMQKGDLRLALRAAYLAGLAHLGHRELLTITRYKSNRDYDRELRRRARSREILLEAFEENLLAFERVWYGEHEVTQESFEQFTGNLERMRAC